MKALSLTQPWASLVANGTKRVETRSWQTSYRGRVAIHAAKGFPGNAQRFAAAQAGLGRIPETLPLGAIIGLATLEGCRRTEDIRDGLTDLERELGDYSSERFGWLMSDPVELITPVECRGALQLWTIPPEVFNAMRWRA